MSVPSTLVSTLISRMQRYQTVSTVEDTLLMRDLDAALRDFKREIRLPWALKRGQLKVFRDVLEYAPASDHNRLAFFQKEQDGLTPSHRIRPRYTSIKEFYEDPTSRDDLAEIFDNGERFLGVRIHSIGQGNQVLSQAETVGDYTMSDDASAKVLDNVTFKRGNGSIKFTVTSSVGTATIKNTFVSGSSFADDNFKQKFHFRWIYLDQVPTSIEMRLQTSDSNYMATSGITTQFSGQAFKADQWNLIAHDLNAATETGTFDSDSIATEKFIMTGAGTGTYFIDESNLRQWEQLAYWYYSKNNVMLTGSTSPDQEFIFNSSDVSSTDSSIVGDSEWIDAIMYDALLITIGEKENENLRKQIESLRNQAFANLLKNYPDLVPRITTYKHIFVDDFNAAGLRNRRFRD